jgi:hypothetical protein
MFVILFEELFRVLPVTEEEKCETLVELRTETEQRSECTLATQKCMNESGRLPGVKRVN